MYHKQVSCLHNSCWRTLTATWLMCRMIYKGKAVCCIIAENMVTVWTAYPQLLPPSYVDVNLILSLCRTLVVLLLLSFVDVQREFLHPHTLLLLSLLLVEVVRRQVRRQGHVQDLILLTRSTHIGSGSGWVWIWFCYFWKFKVQSSFFSSPNTHRMLLFAAAVTWWGCVCHFPSTRLTNTPIRIYCVLSNLQTKFFCFSISGSC